MATESTSMRSRHSSREEHASASHQPNRAALPQLDQTVRFALPDPMHQYTFGKACDSISLTAVARQIVAARTPLFAPTSLSSSVTRVPSRVEHRADRSPHHSRGPSPSPTRTHTSRSSLRAKPVGGVFCRHSRDLWISCLRSPLHSQPHSSLRFQQSCRASKRCSPRFCQASRTASISRQSRRIRQLNAPRQLCNRFRPKTRSFLAL